MMERSEIQGWLAGRIPADWFDGAPQILVDREEILAIGRLPDVVPPEGGDQRAVRLGAIDQHREATREARMRIAEEAQGKFGRVLSWGAECGDMRQLFTHLSLPVMTRLRITERQVLDALVAAGVARSRSHGLAWCVRLVAQHQGDWVKELQEAVASVAKVRSQGPKLH